MSISKEDSKIPIKLHPMVKEVIKKNMTATDVIRAICGKRRPDPSWSIPGISADPPSLKPLVTRFLIPNPHKFLCQPELAKLYGLDLYRLPRNITMRQLGYFLPIVYIADEQRDFGSLGLILNRKSPNSMMSLYPTLKRLRERPIYEGGAMKCGNVFTMVHRIAGFPANRPWKGLPDNPDFKLFYSPDIAMANELCLTDDARPSDFK
jgi:hypothetical protein